MNDRRRPGDGRFVCGYLGECIGKRFKERNERLEEAIRSAASEIDAVDNPPQWVQLIGLRLHLATAGYCRDCPPRVCFHPGECAFSRTDGTTTEAGT